MALTDKQEMFCREYLIDLIVAQGRTRQTEEDPTPLSS